MHSRFQFFKYIATTFTTTWTQDKNMKNKNDDVIVLNVGGIRHQTLRSTLKSLPGTKLASDAALVSHFIDDRGEYFFDRSPSLFEYILNYYRIGELHLPSNVCSNIVRHEFEYWGIECYNLQGCCWLHYNAQCEAYKTMQQFEKEQAERYDVFPEESDQVNNDRRWSCWRRFRPYMWAILEDPYTSKPATLFALLSLLFLLTSIFTFCAETHPYFKGNETIEDMPVTTTVDDQNITTEVFATWYGYPDKTLGIIDITCYTFFTLEALLRITFCPNVVRFIRNGFNVLDMLLVFLFYIEMLVNLFAFQNSRSYQRTILRALFVLRILRVFRVFRLVRHHRGLQVLAYTIRASFREVFLLVMFMTIGVLLFGALVYYADQSEGTFVSIPHGLWWAIVTMTTVGYGDLYPISLLGKIVGGSCAVCGLLMIAFSAPVIVNNFMLFYNQIQYGKKPDVLVQGPWIPGEDVEASQSSSNNNNISIPSVCGSMRKETTPPKLSATPTTSRQDTDSWVDLDEGPHTYPRAGRTKIGYAMPMCNLDELNIYGSVSKHAESCIGSSQPRHRKMSLPPSSMQNGYPGMQNGSQNGQPGIELVTVATQTPIDSKNSPLQSCLKNYQTYI